MLKGELIVVYEAQLVMRLFLRKYMHDRAHSPDVKAWWEHKQAADAAHSGRHWLLGDLQAAIAACSSSATGGTGHMTTGTAVGSTGRPSSAGASGNAASIGDAGGNVNEGAGVLGSGLVRSAGTLHRSKLQAGLDLAARVLQQQQQQTAAVSTQAAPSGSPARLCVALLALPGNDAAQAHTLLEALSDAGVRGGEGPMRRAQRLAHVLAHVLSCRSSGGLLFLCELVWGCCPYVHTGVHPRVHMCMHVCMLLHEPCCLCKSTVQCMHRCAFNASFLVHERRGMQYAACCSLTKVW